MVQAFFARGTSDTFVLCFVPGMTLALVEKASLADLWRCVAGSTVVLFLFEKNTTVTNIYLGFVVVSMVPFVAGASLALFNFL